MAKARSDKSDKEEGEERADVVPQGQQVGKRLQRLAELERKLAASHETGYRGKPYTRASLDKHLSELTRGQYLGVILRAAVVEQEGRLALSYKVDAAALKDLIRAAVALNVKRRSKPTPRRASSMHAD